MSAIFIIAVRHRPATLLEMTLLLLPIFNMLLCSLTKRNHPDPYLNIPSHIEAGQLFRYKFFSCRRYKNLLAPDQTETPDILTRCKN